MPNYDASLYHTDFIMKAYCVTQYSDHTHWHCKIRYTCVIVSPAWKLV